jgi:hypothetical protein
MAEELAPQATAAVESPPLDAGSGSPRSTPEPTAAREITPEQLPIGDEASPEVARQIAADQRRKIRVPYDSIDWSKTNAAIARELGVTRQRISGLRKELKLKDAEPVPPADFSDVAPSSQAKAAAEAEALAGQAPTAEKVVNYAAMAGAVFDMTTGTLCVVFGPEWQPRSPDERGAVVTSMAVYFESKGLQDIPPGLMLTAVLLAYSAPRLREPPTRSKLAAIGGWLKAHWPFRRRRLATPFPQPATAPQP